MITMCCTGFKLDYINILCYSLKILSLCFHKILKMIPRRIRKGQISALFEHKCMCLKSGFTMPLSHESCLCAWCCMSQTRSIKSYSCPHSPDSQYRVGGACWVFQIEARLLGQAAGCMVLAMPILYLFLQN